MTTIVEKRNSVIYDALVKSWKTRVAPRVTMHACILAGKVAQEVLDHFHVENYVTPLAAISMNDLMFDHQMNGVPHTEWNLAAWSVGVGIESPVVVNKDSRDPKGFEGHIGVFTNDHYIDLTAYQLSRPQYDIETAGSLVVPLTDIDFSFSFPHQPLFKCAHLPLVRGHLIFYPNGNSAFEGTPDWQTNYADFTPAVVHDVGRALRSEGLK